MKRHLYYKEYKFVEVFGGTDLLKDIINKFQNQCIFIDKLSEIISDWEESQDDPKYPIKIPLKIKMTVPLLENSGYMSERVYDSYSHDNIIAISFKNPILEIARCKGGGLSIQLEVKLKNDQGEIKKHGFFLGSFDHRGLEFVSMNIFLRYNYRNFIQKAVEEYFSSQK